jgi:hypothetical protein
VPENLKGEFTVKVQLNTEPFKSTAKDTKFTIP